MGLLYRSSDLECAILPEHERVDDGRHTQSVFNERKVLRARFLDHRRLKCCSGVLRHRMEKIDPSRLEVLEGFIIACLNLDRVIDNHSLLDDDPKFPR